MDQGNIGRFIAAKRRERNITQAQLADRLGVSNKTVSKWETGKSMPDYSIVQDLCRELHISVAELMAGEEEEKSFRAYDEEEVIELLHEAQKKDVHYGGILIAMAVMFLLTVWPFGGVWEMLLRPIIGGGTEQSFLYPLYGGIILLAGLIVGCTVCVIEELRTWKKDK